MGTYTNSVAGHVKQLTSGLKRLKYPSSSELPITNHLHLHIWVMYVPPF